MEVANVPPATIACICPQLLFSLKVFLLVYYILLKYNTKLFIDLRHSSDGGGLFILTGDADSCLATLGSAQVAPGHTETPVVLRAMEILHLLTGHIYHHLTHLQPWNNREDIEVRACYWDPNPTTSKY